MLPAQSIYTFRIMINSKLFLNYTALTDWYL